MNRKLLLDLLTEYKNSGRMMPEELPMLEHTFKFITEEPNCFERTNLYGHVTGSAFIINSTNDAFLLMHHKKLDKWFQPGGHADSDHDIARVARKEAEEETGITNFRLVEPTIFDLDVHIFPARKLEPEHFHFDIRFLFQAPPGAMPIQNQESNGVLWIKAEDLTKYNDARSIVRLVEKWQKN